MKITVTHDDILTAGRSGWNCPIARAAQRCFPDKHVYCSANNILAYEERSAWARYDVYILPLEAKLFVAEYDTAVQRCPPMGTKLPEPISFELARLTPIIEVPL